MSAADHRRIAALAERRAVHQAFAWLHLHEPQLRRWQMEFLAVAAPPFGEAPRAAWFRERFQQLGLERAHIDAEGNALAELGGGEVTAEPSPVVLLSAHLDTVFPAGVDCTPREEGPRILCPGASDNGAGLAALLAVAAALKAAEVALPCTLLLAANVGEEGEGDLRGMRAIFAEKSTYGSRIRAAIALEGAGEATVVDRALGSRRLRVHVVGPGGHSWADAGRPNPILALADALAALSKLRLPGRPRTTLNVGTMRGGTSVNSIPEQATADLDLRSVSALELDRTELAVLRTIETELSRHEGLTFRVERIGDRPAGSLAASSALYGSLRAVDRHLRLTTDPRIGSTDANLPLSLGIEALAVGAGGSGWGIHTRGEGYDPTGREVALRRVLLLVLDMCGVVAGQQSHA